MKSWRRILYFLLLNVLVSALTTWAVVTYVLNNYTPSAQAGGPTLVIQSGDGTGVVVITEPSTGQEVVATQDVNVTPGALQIRAIIGAGELAAERVEILNIGDTEIYLRGWRLQDEDGNVYSFPNLTMFKGGAIALYTQAGTSSTMELHWGLDEAVWEIGEKAFLIDPNGDVRAVYEIP